MHIFYRNTKCKA